MEPKALCKPVGSAGGLGEMVAVAQCAGCRAGGAVADEMGKSHLLEITIEPI